MTRYFIIAFAALCFASCSTPSQKKAAEITKLENTVKENGQKNIADTANVKILIADYKNYAQAYPTDSMSPMYLMKAAKFYDFIRLPDSAIYYYHQAATAFPFYTKSDMAMFSEAFIYENEKHDLVKAGAIYKDYLVKYPNTTLAKSVAFELRNLGKTPEQIMAELDSVKHMQADSSVAVQ